LQRVRERVGSEVELLTWRPELLEAMRRFVAEGRMPAWFPAGWERRMARPREEVLVVRRGEEIVGWAEYGPGAPRASFGPVLVLERERGKGYGVLLLLECMLHAEQRGAQRMTAGWANTGFYIAAGWHIYRRYAVLTKELLPPEGIE
jgi:GNAT superfamily N-acetyltransferase